jgi:uncharacterized protein YndB with AHSA1/START domain
MVDILHRVGITSAPEEVYAALTTLDGLAGWWTRNTTGDTGLDGVIAFRFDGGGVDMRVVELVEGKHVLWEVVDGPAEWIGTQVSFELSRAGDWTIVLFAHRGWAEPVEFMHHCSTKWATFLLSLKQDLETGAGTPHPIDVQISDWH